jgi:hypothetical protein
MVLKDSPRTGSTSHGENDFAELRAGFEIGVGSGGFGERKHAVDHWLQLAGSDKLHHHVQLGLGAHIRAEKRKLPTEEETEINLGVVAGGGPTGDQAASGGHAGQTIVPGGPADVFEDNIHAALIGDAPDFFADLLRFVVDEMVGAELLRLLQLFISAGSRKHARAEEFRNLNCGAPDTAPCPEDKNILAGLQLGTHDQHVPRGLENEGDRGGLFEGEIFRIGQAIYFRGANEFGTPAVDQVAQICELAAVIVLARDASGAFAARHSGSENDFLADANRGDFGTDLRNFTGDVAARDVREWNRNARDASAHPKVEVIQRTSLYSDQDFVRADLGVGQVLVAKYLRSTVLLEDDGFHIDPLLPLDLAQVMSTLAPKEHPQIQGMCV